MSRVEDREKFRYNLFNPPAGAHVNPRVEEQLREDEMQAFRQSAGG